MAFTAQVGAAVLLCGGLALAQEVPLAPAPADAGVRSYTLNEMLPSVEGSERRVSLGGYAEAWLMRDGDQTEATLRRFVLFVGYQFTDSIRFFSEVEVEDAKEFEMEQAYLEAEPSKKMGVRAGLLLVPVGLVNLYHEPPVFNGVDRPMVEQVIVPSTWREIGAGLYGTPVEGLHYQLYAMDGLQGAAFSPLAGIGPGRGEGAEAHAENLAVAGRLSFNRVLGLEVAASFYYGGAAQGVAELAGTRVGLVEANARFSRWGLDLRAEYARVFISGAAQIVGFQRLATPDAEAIGAQLQGFYVEGGYNLLRFFPGLDQELVPFVRYENMDPKAVLADVDAPGTSRLAQYLSVGFSWHPHPQLAVKADYRRTLSSGLGDAPNRFSLGLGLMF